MSASIRSPAAVYTPVARTPSMATRSTGVSGRTTRFGRPLAASRYANAVFHRVASTTFDGSDDTPTGCDGSSGSASAENPASRAASRNATWSGAGSSVLAGPTRSVSRAPRR